MIYHAEGSFKVNAHTMAITGFRHDSLVGGKSYAQVREKIVKICRGRLVIFFSEKSDRKCLGLYEPDAVDLVTFDLQKYFMAKNEVTGRYQPIGLKSLVHHYFGDTSFQTGSHSAAWDALYTMRLFTEVYIPNRFTADMQITRVPKFN